MTKSTTLGVLFLAIACGSGNTDAPGEALHKAAGLDTTSSWSQNHTAELRLLGVNAAAFQAAKLRLAKVEVRANGKLLDCKDGETEVDLTNATQAWLLGRVQVPEDAGEVEVRVRFAGTGSFRRGDRDGAIEADCGEIRIRVPVSGLKVRGHAVLHVDVDESLRRHESARAFVPQLKLVF